MDAFIHITESNFESEIIKSSMPVIIEFGATWCKPCKSLEPILVQLGQQQWAGKVRLAHVDIEESPQLAAHFGVMGAPTTFLFVKGNVVAQFSGLQPKDRIIDKFSNYI
jgi:thioredoxin 1